MEAPTIHFTVNGEGRTGAAGMTLRELLRELDLGRARVAIEHNQDVVRSGDWDDRVISGGDRIEIVSFVGGG